MGLDTKHYYDQYWSGGWVIVESVFESKDVDQIADLAVAIAQKEKSGAKQGYEIDFSADKAQQAPRKIDYPVLKDEAFQKFVPSKKLMNIAEILYVRDHY